jgi:hypothetical protein
MILRSLGTQPARDIRAWTKASTCTYCGLTPLVLPSPPFSLSLPRPLTPALSQWEKEAEGVSLTVSTLILAFMPRGKVRVGVNGNTRSLKHGDGVHRRASAADNAQGGNDEHELISALLGANLCQGLQ